MQDNNRRQGVITHFIKERNFGFIKSRDPLSGKVDSFFVHISNIDFCEPEYPSESDLVEFEVSSIPPKPGKYPLADRVSVFNKPALPSAGVSILAGGSITAPEEGGQ